MKKIISIVLVGVFLSSFAYAQNTTDEMSDKDLAAVRAKLNRLKRQMDLLIKDVMWTPSLANNVAAQNFVGNVNVDILQNDKFVMVKADLPGMEKDKIDIVLDNERFLKISGAREIIKSQESPGVFKQERFSGNFSKAVELPCEVMSTGINATYKDGVLEITIPKKVKGVKEEIVKISVK